MLLSDLRLDMDGDAAQIDHLAFNCFGIVNLFQTKSFSTGLTIDAGGTCWNGWGCQRQEIASPLLQTKRHESTLRKALAQCGYDAIEFRHFVLVDCKAKLEKPAKGFENYCRPDRISEAREQVTLGFGTTFRALGRLQAAKAGLVYEKHDTFFATLDGEQLGAQNRSGRHGAYILWPENVQLP